ncbi:MAG: hypothetical protein Q9195_006839 [Heterodermia aff. obscurata]
MATGKSTRLMVSSSDQPELPKGLRQRPNINPFTEQQLVQLHDKKQCTIALDMYRAKISSLSMKLYEEEKRSWNFSKMYLALKMVCKKIDEENHTSSGGEVIALAKQVLAVAEQKTYDRHVRECQQREEDLLRLIPRMLGPQMIASYNWRKLNQDNAARKFMIQVLESDIEQQRKSHKERLKEQNAEIEDLNQEITYLRAQMSAVKNPRKRKSSSETESTESRPVGDKYVFVHCFPGQVPCLHRGRKKRLQKVGRLGFAPECLGQSSQGGPVEMNNQEMALPCG